METVEFCSWKILEGGEQRTLILGWDILITGISYITHCTHYCLNFIIEFCYRRGLKSWEEKAMGSQKSGVKKWELQPANIESG